MRHPLIVGNWKMHGSRHSVQQLCTELTNGISSHMKASLVVCAPTIFLADVQQQLDGSPIAWGGQDVSMHPPGAHTGDIAATMLQDFGCRYAIVGHSERRTAHREENTTVAQKCAAVLQADITPIICIGETEQQQATGETENILAEQLDAIIQLNGIAALAHSVIAYEPVWAIGTGKTATPTQAQAVHHCIRSQVAQQDAAIAEQLQIVYGGSMNAKNAADLLAQPDIDGGLIGGASLQAASFLAIGALCSSKVKANDR